MTAAAKLRSWLNVEPISAQQAAIGTGAGAAAQLAAMWDATAGAVLSLPFFVLTLVAVLNWITGSMNALVDRRFSVPELAKGPLRWSSYIILAVLIANMALLLQDVGGIEGNYSVGVITALYTIAALREADSVIENIDLPPAIRAVWMRFTRPARKHDDEGEA